MMNFGKVDDLKPDGRCPEWLLFLDSVGNEAKLQCVGAHDHRGDCAFRKTIIQAAPDTGNERLKLWIDWGPR